MPIAIVPLSEIGIINTTLKSYDKKMNDLQKDSRKQ